MIRELVERAPRPAEIIVVTSDKALYSYVKTLGASVLRAHEWNALERRPRPTADERLREARSGERHRGWLRTFGGESTTRAKRQVPLSTAARAPRAPSRRSSTAEGDKRR